MAGGGFQHVTKNKLCLKWERHDDANCHRAFALGFGLGLGLLDLCKVEAHTKDADMRHQT